MTDSVQAPPKADVTVTVSISFQMLVEAISKLRLKDKNRLLDILEKQIADAEAEIWLNDPELRAEIEAARAEYEAGEYVTLAELIAQDDAAK